MYIFPCFSLNLKDFNYVNPNKVFQSDQNFLARSEFHEKLLVLGLAVMMTIAFASVTMAGTLGVNVSEGWSVSVEKANVDIDRVEITGNYGVSDLLKLSIGFVTDVDAISFGARYQIAENTAINFKYYTYDTLDVDISEYSIDLRGKKHLNDNLALAGKIGYYKYDYEFPILDFDGFEALGQIEYSFNEFVTGNLGVIYYDYDIDDGTDITLGIEIYPTEKFTIWADYTFDADDIDNNLFGIGVEFAF